MPPESTSLKVAVDSQVNAKADYAAKDSPGLKPKVQNGKIKLSDTAKKPR